ncbi:MAG: hypothetical protein ACOCTT_01285 [archaeon]
MEINETIAFIIAFILVIVVFLVLTFGVVYVHQLVVDEEDQKTNLSIKETMSLKNRETENYTLAEYLSYCYNPFFPRCREVK